MDSTQYNSTQYNSTQYNSTQYNSTQYNSTQYKRKDARQSALEETVRKMGLENFTTEDAKQKIKSLQSIQIAILITF